MKKSSFQTAQCWKKNNLEEISFAVYWPLECSVGCCWIVTLADTDYPQMERTKSRSPHISISWLVTTNICSLCYLSTWKSNIEKNQRWKINVETTLEHLEMIKDRVKPRTLSLKHPIFSSSMQGSSQSSFRPLHGAAHDKTCSQHHNHFTSSQPKQSLPLLQPLSTWASSSLTPTFSATPQTSSSPSSSPCWLQSQHPNPSA